jgi:hypothetical protein
MNKWGSYVLVFVKNGGASLQAKVPENMSACWIIVLKPQKAAGKVEGLPVRGLSLIFVPRRYAVRHGRALSQSE